MKRGRLVGNSALALGGDLATKLGLLLVMVIAARTLSTDEFAAIGTALAASGIIAVALDAGAGLLITRDGARDRAVCGGLLASLGVARMPLGIAVVAIGLGVGVVMGHPVLWTAAAVLGVLGATCTSFIGYFRAGQDMRPEAAQKLLFAVLALAATATVAVSATADALVAGLACAMFASLVLLVAFARRPLRSRVHAPMRRSLGRALPLGLMAIATVVYYRSGTVGLAVLSTPDETAAFTVASAVGFGLLLLPNAITTSLLPHLSAQRDDAGQATRRALGWCLVLSASLALAAALTGYLALGPLFGERYADAALPLAILCAAVVLIAYNGILGTSLLAAGHVRPIALQVACSLVVYLVALVALAPAFGASGAAAATFICEAVAVVMLTVASIRHVQGAVLLPRPALPTV